MYYLQPHYTSFRTLTGFGTCLPFYGKKQGEDCYRDHDCEAGFLCLEDSATGVKSCQAHAAGTQTLGKFDQIREA